MPTIGVQRDLLFKILGRTYCMYWGAESYVMVSFTGCVFCMFAYQLMRNSMSSASTLELSWMKW